MSTSALISRANRSLALAALVAFSALGLFGQSLHALLPCSEGACGTHAVAADESGCCCGHSHAPLASTASADENAGESSGPQVTAAGHDAENCPLCTLLAKIKVGRPSLFHAHVETALHVPVATFGESLLPQDLALSGAPRGPPLA